MTWLPTSSHPTQKVLRRFPAHNKRERESREDERRGEKKRREREKERREREKERRERERERIITKIEEM